MNDDHADAVSAYARTFGNIADVQSARLLSLDALGMDIDVDSAAGRATVRVAFDHEIRDADDARDTLIAMAKAT